MLGSRARALRTEESRQNCGFFGIGVDGTVCGTVADGLYQSITLDRFA